MEIIGTITQVLEELSGTSARGPWRKRDYILQTEGEYPKSVCFTVWGDRIDTLGIQQGQRLQVSVNLESREYNGRWYTDVKAWKVATLEDQSVQAPEPPLPGPGDYPDIPF